jgi:hypothetical protein
MDGFDLDAFEVRLEFKELLRTLSSSQKDVTKVASFALDEEKRGLCTTLFECIKEKLSEVCRRSMLYETEGRES